MIEVSCASSVDCCVRALLELLKIIVVSGRSGSFAAWTDETECELISADLEFREHSPLAEFSELAAEISEPLASPTINGGFSQFSFAPTSFSARSVAVDLGKRTRRKELPLTIIVLMNRPARLLRFMLNDPRVLPEAWLLLTVRSVVGGRLRWNSKLFMKLRRKLVGSFEESRKIKKFQV